MSDAIIRIANTVVDGVNDAVSFEGFRCTGEAVFQLTGTFTGTITFEGSVNGTTFLAMAVTPIAGGATVTTATAAGAWKMDTSAFPFVRARCSAYTSGTPTLHGRWVQK